MLLQKLGYVNTRATGGHLIFHHNNSKSVIALRNTKVNEIIPGFIVASVFRNIVDNKIVTVEKLQNELEKL